MRLILIGLGAAMLACRNPEPTPTDEPRRPPTRPRPVPAAVPVPGAERSLSEATLFSQPLRGGARLEIRSISVRPDSTAVMVPEHEVLLEVRTGEVATEVDGRREVRPPGAAWLVPAGRKVRLWATGQVAVVRGVYLIRPRR